MKTTELKSQLPIPALNQAYTDPDGNVWSSEDAYFAAAHRDGDMTCIFETERWTVRAPGMRDVRTVAKTPTEAFKLAVQIWLDRYLGQPETDDNGTSPQLHEDGAKVDHAVWKKRPDGDWQLFGPVRVLAPPGSVKIRKGDGSIEYRRVYWRSKEFAVNGEPYCFGRPEKDRKCEHCGGWHCRTAIRSIYAGGNMHTGAYWRNGETTCNCGGYLGEAED